jgi:aromatic ring-opening dioxygenase catalytic subunit (LigB family)
MLTSRALLVPHLPTLVVDQHRGHQTEMIEALAAVAARLQAEAPAVVVVLSARWNSAGPFLVDADPHHRTITDYSGLGVELRYDCEGLPALARVLARAGRKAGVRVETATRGVDSGVTVPLHFLLPARGVPVVPLSLASRPATECRAWGAALRRALVAWPDRAAFVVGGVLSNNAHASRLGREVPEARALDAHALEVLGQGAWSRLKLGVKKLEKKAQPEAGLRHLEVLRGFLGDSVAGEIRCYQPAPGIGAVLAEFELAESDASQQTPAA